jgi:hypothetical protein
MKNRNDIDKHISSAIDSYLGSCGDIRRPWTPARLATDMVRKGYQLPGCDDVMIKVAAKLYAELARRDIRWWRR